MTDKSHVTMERHVCKVCCERFDTGSLLLDQRLRPVFEHFTTTGWGLCPKCLKLKDDGYVALVGCKNSPPEGKMLGPEEADRTGNIAHVRLTAWASIFNVPPPPEGIAFCGDDVIEILILIGKKETEQ